MKYLMGICMILFSINIGAQVRALPTPLPTVVVTPTPTPTPVATATAAPNTPPVVYAADRSTSEDTSVTISFPAAYDADGDGLTYKIVGHPYGRLSACALANSVYSCLYTPLANFNGTDKFTYKVFDGKIYSNTATITIAVSAVNDAPSIITSSCDTYATSGTLYQCQFRATDPERDTVTWTFSNNGGCSFLSLSTTGLLSGTPTNSTAGIGCSLVVKASDPSQAFATSNFTVYVASTIVGQVTLSTTSTSLNYTTPLSDASATIKAVVYDSSAIPMKGATVHLNVPANGGSIVENDKISDANGEVVFTLVRSSTPGTYLYSATSNAITSNTISLIFNRRVSLNWDDNRETSVNRVNGGYQLCHGADTNFSFSTALSSGYCVDVTYSEARPKILIDVPPTHTFFKLRAYGKFSVSPEPGYFYSSVVTTEIPL